MTNNKIQNWLLIFLYFGAIFLVFPILRYLIVYFKIGDIYFAQDKFAGIRVFLSGPGLVLISFVLIKSYDALLHKTLGIIIGLVGLVWLLVIVSELYSKL